MLWSNEVGQSYVHGGRNPIALEKGSRKPPGIGLLFKCKGKELLLCHVDLVVPICGGWNGILEGVSNK